MKKYCYTSKDLNNIIFFKTLEELMLEYFKICNKGYIKSGFAEINFKREIKKDGYHIVAQHTGEIYYYFKYSKIKNIFNELSKDHNDIVDILNKKLRKFKLKKLF